MDIKKGDLVKIIDPSKINGRNTVDATDEVLTTRVCKVDKVDGRYIFVRPKYLRSLVLTHPENLEIVESKEIKKRGRPKKPSAEQLIRETPDLTEEQKEETISVFIEDGGSLNREFEDLYNLCQRVHRKIGCNHGPVTMYHHIIGEIKRHTDKKKVQRG